MANEVIRQATDTQIEEQKSYPCQHCDRKFTTSQALGGHQNAHKAERTAARKAQKDLNYYSNLSFLRQPLPHYLHRSSQYYNPQYINPYFGTSMVVPNAGHCYAPSPSLAPRLYDTYASGSSHRKHNLLPLYPHGTQDKKEVRNDMDGNYLLANQQVEKLNVDVSKAVYIGRGAGGGGRDADEEQKEEQNGNIDLTLHL